MQLLLSKEGLAAYKSKSQLAGRATEFWANSNLYCPNCDSPTLSPRPRNAAAVDYDCPKCAAPFQLKAQSRAFGSKILDSAYSKMVREILEGRTPNLFAIHYEPDEWQIANLLLIPQFAFPLSAIEKRKPLAATARRAGWVGCNILLHAIPPDARISIVRNGQPTSPSAVRREYARLKPLAQLEPKQRGWTLDVLNAVRSLNKSRFTIDDVYAFESHLSRLHPQNRHVKDKIRQQLQVLRDLGLLRFEGHGNYSLS